MCLFMAAVASLAVTTQAWNLGFLQSTSAPSPANASGPASINNTAPKKTKPSFLQVVSSSDSTSGSEEAEVVSDAAVDAIVSGTAVDAVLKDAAGSGEALAEVTDDEHEYEQADDMEHSTENTGEFGGEDVGTESNEVADEDSDEAEDDSHDADDDEEDEEESAAKESRHLFEDYHGEAFLQDEDSDHEETSDSEEDGEDEDEDDEEVEIADPDSESDMDNDEIDGHEDSFAEIDEGELDIDDSAAEEAWEHEEENYRLEA